MRRLEEMVRRSSYVASLVSYVASLVAAQRRVDPQPDPPLQPDPPQAGGRAGAPMTCDRATRLYEGRRRSVFKGKPPSGPAPYGYLRNGKGGDFVVDQVEGPIVQEIFREYLRLRSLERVVEALGARGLKTRRGCAFSKTALAWILTNSTYVGVVRFNGIRRRGRHEPLVARIVFNKAGQRLRMNDKRTRRGLREAT